MTGPLDATATPRLRLLGYAVLAACAVLTVLPGIGGEDLKFQEAVGALAAAGIGLLLVAELGPFLKSIRAGGVEVQFIESVGSNVSRLEERIAELERRLQAMSAASPRAMTAEVPKAADAPALSRPVVSPDDQNKGRFGGVAKAGGFELSATFPSSGRDWAEVELTVRAEQGMVLSPGTAAELFLHETFDPDRMVTPFREGRATIRLWATGGFTVGAWIPSHGVELELDLSTLRGAPQVVKER